MASSTSSALVRSLSGVESRKLWKAGESSSGLAGGGVTRDARTGAVGSTRLGVVTTAGGGWGRSTFSRWKSGNIRALVAGLRNERGTLLSRPNGGLPGMSGPRKAGGVSEKAELSRSGVLGGLWGRAGGMTGVLTGSLAGPGLIMKSRSWAFLEGVKRRDIPGN